MLEYTDGTTSTERDRQTDRQTDRHVPISVLMIRMQHIFGRVRLFILSAFIHIFIKEISTTHVWGWVGAKEFGNRLRHVYTGTYTLIDLQMHAQTQIQYQPSKSTTETYIRNAYTNTHVFIAWLTYTQTHIIFEKPNEHTQAQTNTNSIGDLHTDLICGISRLPSSVNSVTGANPALKASLTWAWAFVYIFVFRRAARYYGQQVAIYIYEVTKMLHAICLCKAYYKSCVTAASKIHCAKT